MAQKRLRAFLSHFFSVKKGFQKVRRLFGSQNKNNSSLNYAQSSAEGILSRPNPAGFLQLFVRKSGCNDAELWLNRGRIF
ncbi:hypothetical protein, partial [Faecalibacterium prausnitzii]|uniref:hypothetical protein n=1 Tax=Faecalibacterium prausnitzii TaxID=853 RepID=UPI001A9A693D